MPQGSGKTLVAAATQRLMDVKSVNLTHTISLQEQYHNTIPQAALVTGRRNHLCELPGFETAKDAPCENGQHCDYMRADGCSYYRMLFSSAESPAVITNYAYATRIMQLDALKWARRDDTRRTYNPFRRELLVCDEGHLIEGALVDSAKTFIMPSSWDTIGHPIPESLDVLEWIAWAVEGARKVGSLKGDMRRADYANDYEFFRKMGRYNVMHQAADRIAEIREPSDWIIVRQDKFVVVRPIWGWAVAHDALWNNTGQTLIMSATLGDPAIIRQSLAIDEASSTYLDIPSTFPVENRPVYYWPIARLSMKSTASDWDKVASAIALIATHEGNATRKGIVHTGSFKVANLLRKHLTNSRYLYHDSADASRTLARFVSSEEPLILVTPSFTTGIDIPYQIGWQVIAKVPFGDLGDPIVRARRETTIEGRPFGKLNYDSETLNTVVQAAGRAVRAADDHGATYIVDGNFWPLYKRAYSPRFFRESVRWLRV